MAARDRVLVAAVPLRHLEEARARCDVEGSVLLPAGGPGDLDAAPRGTTVLLIATDAGEAEVPAATWSATFVGRVPYAQGEPWPPGVPASWVQEHPADEARFLDDGDPDEDVDDDPVGPQSFLHVTDLAPRPREAWVFANELVPKQERGGRTFVPRTPRLLLPVD